MLKGNSSARIYQLGFKNEQLNREWSEKKGLAKSIVSNITEGELCKMLQDKGQQKTMFAQLCTHLFDFAS